MSTESVTVPLSHTTLNKTSATSKPSSINSTTFLAPSKDLHHVTHSIYSTSSHSTISDNSAFEYSLRYFPYSDEFFAFGNEKTCTKLYPGRGILKRTSSLEDFTYCNAATNNKHETRRKSAQIYRENIGAIRKRSPSGSKSKKRKASRANGVSGGDVELRMSNNNLPIHPRTYSNTSTRSILLNSKKSSKQSSIECTPEETQRLKRRKKIINIILGVYLFLFFISILCVVVTLTHRTTKTVQFNNSTKNLTYYTFSPTIQNETEFFRNTKIG